MFVCVRKKGEGRELVRYYCIARNFVEVCNLVIWRIRYRSPNELNPCVPMAYGEY